MMVKTDIPFFVGFFVPFVMIHNKDLIGKMSSNHVNQLRSFLFEIYVSNNVQKRSNQQQQQTRSSSTRI